MDGADSTRFAALYLEHYPPIFNTCFRRLGDRGAAEDAAAEVFATVWRRYRTEAIARITLYAIARNVVGNEYRRANRARAVQFRLAEEAANWSPTAERPNMLEALLELGPRDRELLRLAYWEDLTAKQIAEILHSSPGAVWVRLTRARTKLREALASESGAYPL